MCSKATAYQFESASRMDSSLYASSVQKFASDAQYSNMTFPPRDGNQPVFLRCGGMVTTQPDGANTSSLRFYAAGVYFVVPGVRHNARRDYGPARRPLRCGLLPAGLRHFNDSITVGIARRSATDSRLNELVVAIIRALELAPDAPCDHVGEL